MNKEIINQPHATVHSFPCGLSGTPLSNGASLLNEMKKSHGDYCNHKTTKLCGVWQSMKQRVLNPHSPSYHNYGGRGITICDKWMNYIPFKAWALSHGYKEGLTIERINNDLGYYPENCCFMPKRLNNLNRRRRSSYGICGFMTKYGIYYKVLIRLNNKIHYNKGSRDYNIALKLRDELVEFLKPEVEELKIEYDLFKRQNLLP